MIIIRIPNDVFYKSHRLLSPDELLVLSLLIRNRNLDNEIHTTVNFLNEFFKFQKGNDRKNKPYLKNILLSLIRKEYLISDGLHIESDNQIILLRLGAIKKGYCGLSSAIFDEIVKDNDILHAKLKVFVYVYVHCFGSQGRKISYDKISSLCNYFNSEKKYSISTMKKIISEMDGKYIFKFSGKFIEDDLKYDSNVYFTELNDIKMKKYKDHVESKNRNSENGEANEKAIFTVSCGELTVLELKRIAEEDTNWQKKYDDGSYKEITEFDYEIFRTCVDENVNAKFVQRCRKGIKVMKEFPEKYPYNWDEMERTYLKEKSYSEVK